MWLLLSLWSRFIFNLAYCSAIKVSTSAFVTFCLFALFVVKFLPFLYFLPFFVDDVIVALNVHVIDAITVDLCSGNILHWAVVILPGRFRTHHIQYLTGLVCQALLLVRVISCPCIPRPITICVKYVYTLSSECSELTKFDMNQMTCQWATRPSQSAATRSVRRGKIPMLSVHLRDEFFRRSHCSILWCGWARVCRTSSKMSARYIPLHTLSLIHYGVLFSHNSFFLKISIGCFWYPVSRFLSSNTGQ